MKCFYHEEVDAVAVCRACGRGVCAECTVVTDGEHIVCCQRCQGDDDKTIASNAAVVDLMLATTRSYKGLVVLFNLLAVTMFMLAIALPSIPFSSSISDENLFERRAITLGGGAVFAAIGIICLVGARTLAKVGRRHDDLVQRMPRKPEVVAQQGGPAGPSAADA